MICILCSVENNVDQIFVLIKFWLDIQSVTDLFDISNNSYFTNQSTHSIKTCSVFYFVGASLKG